MKSISCPEGKYWLSISESGGNLHMVIENTNHAKRENKFGGNDKIKKILKLGYPGRHTLNIVKGKKMFTLELWIQLY